MDVYFSSAMQKIQLRTEESCDMMGSKIDKIVARGNVKIVRGENVSYSDEAIYTAADKKITLSGRPKLIIYSTEEYECIFWKLKGYPNLTTAER